MADDKDIQGHAATYGSLIQLLKWGAVAVFIIAFFVLWLIAPATK